MSDTERSGAAAWLEVVAMVNVVAASWSLWTHSAERAVAYGVIATTFAVLALCHRDA